MNYFMRLKLMAWPEHLIAKGFLPYSCEKSVVVEFTGGMLISPSKDIMQFLIDAAQVEMNKQPDGTTRYEVKEIISLVKI